jgi:hypothetical protein
MWTTLLFQWECSGYEHGQSYSGRGRISVRNADTPQEVKQQMIAKIRQAHPEGASDIVVVYNIRETNKWSEIED